MQQRGSKYDNKFKEEALALVASGVSITKAACRLRIPKSTLADWVHTQNEGDEDGVAARREIRRAQIKRCNRIVDKSLRALDLKIDGVAKSAKKMAEGLDVLVKAAADGVISLTDAELATLREAVSDYSGVGLRELSGTIKEVAARQETLEQHLGQSDESGVQITFEDGEELFAVASAVHCLWRCARRRKKLRRAYEGRTAVSSIRWDTGAFYAPDVSGTERKPPAARDAGTERRRDVQRHGQGVFVSERRAAEIRLLPA